MTSISLKTELPDEFLSDILITAFDGAYGASWEWFEPVRVGDRFWLTTNGDVQKPSTDDLWLAVRIRLREDCETGHPVLDRRDGFEVDHEALGRAIQAIIDDEYVGIWRKANEREVNAIMEVATADEGELPFSHGRRFRLKKEPGAVWEVETGETARGYRDSLIEIVNHLASGEADAGDIDAPFADAIVQVAALGKVVFS